MLMNIEKYDLIMVRGAPAVGKTTLGKGLKKAFSKGFVVEVDYVRAMVNSVNWVQKEEHLKALDATEKLVKSYLASGYKPAIVIDTFNPSKLKLFVDNFKNYAYIIVSLYADNDVLEQRLINRETGFKDWDMTKILNDEIGKYRHDKEILLDTSTLNKEEVLRKFIQIVENV